MLNYNTREITLDLIIDITKQKAYNNIALKRVLYRYNDMKIEDKAFITEMVNGTLRNMIYIDYIIEQFSSVKINKMKEMILNILRIAIYQIKFMDRVPNSAACNEAVKLAKKRGYEGLSGFVNGLLRNITRNKDSIKLPDENKNPLLYLSVLYSYPEWIIDKWLKEYEYNFVKDMCIKNNLPPDVTVCVNTLKTNTKDLKIEFEKRGVFVEYGKYSNQSLHISKTSDISKLSLYNKGYFHIQDESSIIAVDILDPHEGEYIIDVCAAPGGKSLLCAEKMNNTGIIKSRDIYKHKLDMILESSKLMGIDIIDIQNINAEIEDTESICKADRVLIDAPCSGLGLLRKKSDIKLKKNVEDIEKLQKIQRKILTVCSEYVKLEGVIVYSTCTISKEENIDNINWFIKNFPFELENIAEFLPKNIYSNTAENGYIQLYTNIHDTDGFFIARMKRKR